jgi:prophage regulatory protein
MKIIKLPEVMEMTGLSRSSIYAFVKKGDFPSPRKLGIRAVGWVLEEIVTWIENRKPNAAISSERL